MVGALPHRSEHLLEWAKNCYCPCSSWHWCHTEWNGGHALLIFLCIWYTSLVDCYDLCGFQRVVRRLTWLVWTNAFSSVLSDLLVLTNCSQVFPWPWFCQLILFLIIVHDCLVVHFLLNHKSPLSVWFLYPHTYQPWPVILHVSGFLSSPRSFFSIVPSLSRVVGEFIHFSSSYCLWSLSTCYIVKCMLACCILKDNNLLWIQREPSRNFSCCR